MKKNTIIFIINPISGNKKQKNIVRYIDLYLNKENFDYKIFYSEYQKHMIKITTDAIANGSNIIIVVGGDGSVNEVMQNLIGTNIILGIIPTGSGNGLARYLNIPLNIKKAIRLINNFTIQKIDTGNINKHFFINAAGLGFDVVIAQKFSQFNKRGFWTYVMIVLKSYFSYREKEYLLKLNHIKKIRTKALLICFANSNQYGNEFRIAPKAKINDGLIDVCIINKIPIWVLPITLFLIYFNRIEKSRYYKHFQANDVYIESVNKQLLNLDGEYVQVNKKLKLTMYPSSIKIICPEFKNEQ